MSFSSNSNALKIIALIRRPNILCVRWFSRYEKDPDDLTPQVHPGAPKTFIDKETSYFKKEEREKLEALKKKQRKKKDKPDYDEKNDEN